MLLSILIDETRIYLMTRVQESSGRRHVYIPQSIWTSSPWEYGDRLVQWIDDSGRYRLRRDSDEGYVIQRDQTVSLDKTLADALGFEGGVNVTWGADLIDQELSYYIERKE